ncbi:hypothetical protein [Paenibacillus phytorum]|uniref:hypothetical protein n=1 Tax=Paenibacillus phytorum TaxID=2654977 RepID=UPI0014919208|nr:hypothetical protein [Paenibacillus phytorum]
MSEKLNDPCRCNRVVLDSGGKEIRAAAGQNVKATAYVPRSIGGGRATLGVPGPSLFIGSLLSVIQQFFNAQWPLKIGTVLAVWSVYAVVVYLL